MRLITKTLVIALIASVSVLTACKKGPETKVQKSWNITQFEAPNMDSTALAAIQAATNTVEFTKKGKVIMVLAGEEMEGTYTLNETATSMTTTMNGGTDSYAISGLTDNSMTLSSDEGKMVLSSN